MQQFLRKTALPAVLIVAAGCATSSSLSNANVPEAHPRVIAARVQSAGWSAPDTHSASALYALKCGRCHKFYDPAAYSSEDWDLWFHKMTKKAKLEPSQEKQLSDYLSAARKNEPIAK
jgi:cytochrome c5